MAKVAMVTIFKRILAWLAADADAMWEDADWLDRAAENERREQYGGRELE